MNNKSLINLQNKTNFEEILKNSPKSDGEIGNEDCQLTKRNEEQGYQGDVTEWIYEEDEDGNIYMRMMGSGKKEKPKK